MYTGSPRGYEFQKRYNTRVPQNLEAPSLNSSATRSALVGFFVSGMLMAFVGAILPAWGFHLGSDFTIVGDYFLVTNIGFLVAAQLGQRLLSSRGLEALLSPACLLASSAFVYLAFCAPPVPDLWRFAGFLVLGLAAGFLNSGILQAITPIFRHNAAATLNLSGVFFGAGCLTIALFISGAFEFYSVSTLLLFIAAFPAFMAVVFARRKISNEAASRPRSFPDHFPDFRSPSAVLFSLLLFFQFANEWSIAGWLPLFLIQRLGLSPTKSLLMLAFYWLSLLVGRLLAQQLMLWVRHGYLLTVSAAGAILGCTVLALTDNLFGALFGILLVGCAFASIYPLVMEKIGFRFASYSSGHLNGMFSLALTGGMLGPWALGYFAATYGVGIVMILPLLGTVAVFILLLLILLEAKVSGRVLMHKEQRELR